MKFFLPVISLLFFSFTYSNSHNDFGIYDISLILFLLGLFCANQTIFIKYVSKSDRLKKLLFSLFALGNIFSLNLIFYTQVYTSSLFEVLLALCVGGFILFTLIDIMGKNIHFRKICFLIFSVATIFNFVAPIWSTSVSSNGSIDSAEIIKGFQQQSSIPIFAKKPNIYMVSFDGLIPQSLFERHFEIKQTEYHKVLNEYFMPYKNMFADAVYTKNSLNSMLAFTPKHYIHDEENKQKFFNGIDPSPFFKIFKANGYNVTAFIHGTYFGTKKGPNIDRFVRSISTYFTACDFVDGKTIRTYSLLGYCNVSYFIQMQFFPQFKFVNYTVPRPFDHVKSLIKNAEISSEPNISFGYILRPKHTPPTTYDATNAKEDGSFERYRSHFLNRSKEVAVGLKEIVELLAQKDPTAILVVFGDHGAILSRGLPFKENLVFSVLDQYGVYAGIYPKNRCSKWIDGAARSHSTLQQLAHDLVICLTQDKNTFALDYPGGMLKRDFLLDRPDLEYKDFVYE